MDQRIPTSHRACTRCGEKKPVSEFGRDRHTPDGLNRACRPCTQESSRKYRQANPGRHGEALRAKRVADPDAERERERLWREANRDKIQAKNQRFRQKNPRYESEWRAANADRVRASGAKRDALKRLAAVGDIDLAALWTGVCGICGGVMDESLKHPDPLSKSIDHIHPLILGGSHEQSNLQWSHLRCNLRKGARPSG